MAANFADDGAFGAGGTSPGQSATSFGAMPLPGAANEEAPASFGGAASPSQAQSTLAFLQSHPGATELEGGGFESSDGLAGLPGSPGSASPSSSPAGTTPSGGALPAGFGGSGGGGIAANPGGVGFSLSAGGAIPTGDDDGSDDSNGSPQQDAISKALDSVDQVLAFGRKAHGLGGDQEGDGPAIQTAQAGYQNNRMPALPGSQSNSGVPPIQPQPGPLPPTSNPFGKRADATQPGDNDTQSGAIDTGDDEGTS